MKRKMNAGIKSINIDRNPSKGTIFASIESYKSKRGGKLVEVVYKTTKGKLCKAKFKRSYSKMVAEGTMA